MLKKTRKARLEPMQRKREPDAIYMSQWSRKVNLPLVVAQFVMLKGVSKILISSLLFFVGLACAAPSYPILDSGFPATDRQQYWLDNERVIFVGYKVGEYTDLEKRGDGSKGKKIHTGIFIWDTRNNRVAKYADSEEFLCFADGYIVYSLPTGPDYAGPYGLGPYKAGRLGAETTFPSRQRPKNLRTNPFTCRDFDYKQSLSNKRLIQPLRDEHGYLDLGVLGGKDSLKNIPITLYPPGKRGVTLPIGRREVAHIDYYAFKGAYFVSRHFYDKAGSHKYLWPAGTTQIEWWLYTDGKVDEVKIPSGPWESGGVVLFFPTRQGIFLVSHKLKSYEEAGVAGAYYVRGSRFDKLITGYITHAAISPHGCRVAFVYVPSLQAQADSLKQLAAGRASKRTLKMVDLCANGA